MAGDLRLRDDARRCGRAVLEDLGSRNGTWVCGRPIAGPIDSLGDTIVVGPEEIVFLGASATRQGPR